MVIFHLAKRLLLPAGIIQGLSSCIQLGIPWFSSYPAGVQMLSATLPLCGSAEGPLQHKVGLDVIHKTHMFWDNVFGQQKSADP